MYKRILSFILILCMSINVSTNVYLGYNAKIGAGETLILTFEACCGSESAKDEPTNYKLTTVDKD